MSQKSDRELVEAARKGDSEAFGVLVRRHQKRIYRLAAHLLRDGAEAEDVTQDTFVRAYAALDRFDGRSEAFTWMYRIAVNLSLNAIRSRKTSRKATTPDDPRIEGLLACLLYTSDAADERSSVDLGGRRIIKKKKIRTYGEKRHYLTYTVNEDNTHIETL